MAEDIRLPAEGTSLPSSSKVADPPLGPSLTSPSAKSRATIGAIREPPLPVMTVNEAIDEITATGTGAWAFKCVSGLALSASIVAIETVMNTYLSGCVGQTFDVGTSGPAQISAANLAGTVCGCLFLSPIADIYGRRWLLLWSTCFSALFCLLAAAAPTYHLFLLGRFCSGFCKIFLVAVSFVAEHVSTAHRGMLTNHVCGIAWGVGTTFMNLLAWLILPHYGWRVLLVAFAIPVTLNIFQLYMLVESPRWLVSQGRIGEAYAALEYIAAGNGTVMPCSWLVAAPGASHESTPLIGTDTAAGPFGLIKRIVGGYQSLFTGSRFGLLFALTLAYWFQQFAFFGIVFYDNDILGSKSGHSCHFDYGFDTFVGTSEIAGSLLVIPLLDIPDYSPWISGRVGTQASCYCAGIVAVALVANSVPNLVFWAYASRGLWNGACSVMMIQSVEVLDVQYRTTGIGYLSAVGMASGVISPYWVLSGNSQQIVGLGLALAAGIGMLAAFMLPETAGRELDKGSFEKLRELPWLQDNDTSQSRRHSV